MKMDDTIATNNVGESKPVAEYKFPGPEDKDFDEDITKEEREYYKCKYKDLTRINKEKLHCTSCDKHLGSMPKHESRMQMHPMLRTLVCRACHKFYNSGEFEQGDDGSELYCRWCGQGGQVYCCSSCPIVFCAKCVKRNFGASKVEEIENSDDWNCFKCESKDLWDLRALCWALLRYCDMKNKLARLTEDEKLQDRYEEECAIDESQCCKRKSINKKKKVDEIKKEVPTPAKKKLSIEEAKSDNQAPLTQPKIIISPPVKVNSIAPVHGIQVKKFAMEMGEIKLRSLPSGAPNSLKRPASPNYTNMPAGPVKIFPAGVPVKKMKNSHSITPPVKISKPNKAIRQFTPIVPRPFNGHPSAPRYAPPSTFPRYHKPPPSLYANQMSFANDNINLSLESLTQGLDMSAMTSATSKAGTNFGINYPPGVDGTDSAGAEDEVLCTPDFMEPICEVLEEGEGADDDVQCITPEVSRAAPALPPPPLAPPPVSVSRLAAAVHSYSPDNIVQMTEQDVTVNKETGGLKFKVDPQTLSSHKMYRLPDGRIFAINVNPNMPGGYSATIVALAPENMHNAMRAPAAPNRVTFPAKVTTVVSKEPPALVPTPRILNSVLLDSSKMRKNLRSKTKPTILRNVTRRSTESNSSKPRDMKTSVEWLRYNLVDAVDLMEYVLKRLKKMDNNAQISELRTKSVDEMKALHRQLDQLMKTSVTRFTEVRTNLDDGLKEWLRQKGVNSGHDDEDDDDVEILSDDGRDEPIFIDENSSDSLQLDDRQATIVSTKSGNDTPNDDVGGESSSVYPLLNAIAATDSSKTDDELVNEDRGKSRLENSKDSDDLNESENIRSQIFLEDEDNVIDVNNSSDTSVIETDLQKTNQSNSSRKSDDKAPEESKNTKCTNEEINLPDKDTKSIDEAPASVNKENTLADGNSKSDEEREINEIQKPSKETKPGNEQQISPDEELKSADEDTTLGDEEAEKVNEEMAVDEEEQESVVDEEMTSADEEPKANKDSKGSERSKSDKENTSSKLVDDREPCDEAKILPGEEDDRIEENEQERNLDEKITEAEEDDLLSSNNDSNVENNHDEKTNGIEKKKCDAGNSTEKVDSDEPISDELIDNLLGSNDDIGLRSELEKFAEGALDTADFVEPEFV